MFKIILSILSALVTTSVGVATFTVVSASRGEVAPLTFTLASHLTPGSPMPFSSWCNWHDYAYFQDGSISCQTFQADGTLVSFTYSYAAREITRASFAVNNQTIGKLIVAWGDPTGYELHGRIIEVFWGKRSAWTIGAFSPSSKVYFVGFYNKVPANTSAWAGFITLPS